MWQYSKMTKVLRGLYAYKIHKHFWKENDDGKYIRITEASYSARQKRGKNQPLEKKGLASAELKIRNGNRRVGDNVKIIENNDFKSSIDIHDEFDFWLAETVYKNWNKKEKNIINLDFLGNDLQSWSQSIRNGYIRLYNFALHETGVFELMKKENIFQLSKFQKNVNSTLFY